MNLIYDPDEEVDNLLTSLHEAYVLNVQEQVQQGSRQPVCEARDALDDFNPDWWTAYDDVTGAPLDPSMVREAREKEIQVIRDVGVWNVVPRESIPRGMKAITGRWVDINKGDTD